MTSNHSPAAAASTSRDPAAPIPAFVPAAVLLGVTGAIIGQGHDGLALTLGLAGGAYLWASGLLPFAPADRDSGGLPGFLARRYASPLVGLAATAVLAIALVCLLAAELTALTASVAALTPYLPFGSFVPVVVLVLLATLAAGRFQASEHLPAVSVVAVALTLLALVAGLAALSGPDGLGVAVSTPTLGEIGSLERGLLEKRLADPSVFKPYASPFLRLDLANTLSIILCLSFGAAILASARIGRRSPAVAPTCTCALVFAIAALLMVPALAAAARRTLLALVDSGLKAGSLPAWLSSLQTSGAAAICNAPSEAGPAALVKACGKGVGPEGLMRWQDVTFTPDSTLVATLSSLPETPLANAALAFVLLAAAAATLATAYGAAATLHAALFRPADTGRPHTGARLILVAVIWLLATLFTATRPASSATLLVWAASIAAAGLAPVVIASALPRPSRTAALAAMTLGSALVLALTLTTRYDAMDALAVATAYEPMAPPALRKMTSLFTALSLASDEPAKAALMNQIEALARDNTTWIGLKPIAAGAWGLLASAAVMALFQAIALGIGRVRKH